MTADVQKKYPKPPSFSHVFAVLLEVSIFATFLALQSKFGALLCGAYFYFSATWAAVFSKPHEED
jgi:hypothetical protein